MKARYKLLLWLIFILLIICFIWGFFDRIHRRYLNGEPEIKIVGNLSINYKDGINFYVKDKKEIHFSVINNSDKSDYYFIALKKVKNVSNVSYAITKNGTTGSYTEFPIYDDIISNYVLIDGNSTDEYVISLEPKQDSTFSFALNIDSITLEDTSFAQVILHDNNVKSEPLTEVGKEAAKEDEGLIKTIDDFGTAYYFRGNVKNNYVLIDGLYFRILHINGDSTVSMVLDGYTNVLKKYYETAGEYQFDNSLIQNYLLSWVQNTIIEGKTYISTYKYCNEDQVDEKGVMNAFGRINDNIASLVCLGSRVQSKVGLLTVDEVLLAGGSLKESNGDFYLYNSEVKTDSYLLTGAALTNNVYYPYILGSNGLVTYKTPGTNLRAVRPVITTFKNVSATGKGTLKEPYILTK